MYLFFIYLRKSSEIWKVVFCILVILVILFLFEDDVEFVRLIFFRKFEENEIIRWYYGKMIIYIVVIKLVRLNFIVR